MFDERNGNLELIIGAGKLPSQIAAGAKTIALLLAGGRQAAGIEEWTSLDVVREVCGEFKKLDSANFSKTIRSMTHEFNVRKESERKTTVRVSRPGWDEFSALPVGEGVRGELVEHESSIRKTAQTLTPHAEQVVPPPTAPGLAARAAGLAIAPRDSVGASSVPPRCGYSHRLARPPVAAGTSPASLSATAAVQEVRPSSRIKRLVSPRAPASLTRRTPPAPRGDSGSPGRGQRPAPGRVA